MAAPHTEVKVPIVNDYTLSVVGLHQKQAV